VAVPHLKYEGWYEGNASNFLSENIIARAMKFIWMICTAFAIMRLFFHSLCHFQHTLPTLSKTLYTNVVKFSASTSENIKFV
jgi:hypothetical protein